MTYKETLFFIGKCLTITHEEHNRLEVEQELKNGQVDWDAVVKASTANYVFPALYCNLKRANFLSYLPEELVNYMIHITDLNRDRNQQIITQAKELNELLLANNITPIFLKGTAFLLQDFYEDIAERMVGDIDFLVSEEEFEKTVELLKKDGYLKIRDVFYYPEFHRHYQKIVKKDLIASVEIHKEMIEHSHTKFFNYKTVKNTLITKKNTLFLSLLDQLTLTSLAIQMNDFGHIKKTIAFRNFYDVFLISTKINTQEVLKPPFIKFINPHFKLTSFFFNTESIQFIKNNKVNKHLKSVMYYMEHPLQKKYLLRFINAYLRFNVVSSIALKSLYKKKYRKYFLNRIFSFKWIKWKLLNSKPSQ